MSALAVVGAVAVRSWKKTLRRPVVLSFSLVQPLLWMLLFGFLFQRYQVGPLPRDATYLEFLLPGVCAMTVLFGASQSGIELIRDLQTGFLGRLLTTPSDPRLILLGKLLADVLRLLLQASVVLGLGVLLGARIAPTVTTLVPAALAVALFALAFTSLSCAIALIARAPEGMAAFVHIVNMPLLFTSTALVPRQHMPPLLQALAGWNPLTLAVDTLRRALLFGEPSRSGSVLPLLLGFACASFALASLLLPRATRE